MYKEIAIEEMDTDVTFSANWRVQRVFTAINSRGHGLPITMYYRTYADLQDALAGDPEHLRVVNEPYLAAINTVTGQAHRLMIDTVPVSWLEPTRDRYKLRQEIVAAAKKYDREFVETELKNVFKDKQLKYSQ